MPKTLEEHKPAVDALINWFHSQDIGPSEGIEIMAAAICVAVISNCKGSNAKLADGIEKAAKRVVAMALEICGEAEEKYEARKSQKNSKKN